MIPEGIILLRRKLKQAYLTKLTVKDGEEIDEVIRRCCEHSEECEYMTECQVLDDKVSDYLPPAKRNIKEYRTKSIPGDWMPQASIKDIRGG
jgi:hypothetical protein